MTCQGGCGHEDLLQRALDRVSDLEAALRGIATYVDPCSTVEDDFYAVQRIAEGALEDDVPPPSVGADQRVDGGERPADQEEKTMPATGEKPTPVEGREPRVSGKNPVLCTFCEKSNLDVEILIRCPRAVICSECVELSVDIIREHRDKACEALPAPVPRPSDAPPPVDMSWADEDPGTCPTCGALFELVRPGKSQQTCSCWDEPRTNEAGIDDLIERSSLGTPEAKALREGVPQEVVDRVLARADELERQRTNEARNPYHCPRCSQPIKPSDFDRCAGCGWTAEPRPGQPVTDVAALVTVLREVRNNLDAGDDPARVCDVIDGVLASVRVARTDYPLITVDDIYKRLEREVDFAQDVKRSDDYVAGLLVARNAVGNMLIAAGNGVSQRSETAVKR